MVVSVQECKNLELTRMHLQMEFIPYLYFIMYNFEALLTPLQSAQTSHLMLTSSYVLISIAVNDNLTNEPIFLKNIDPKTLIQSFIKELAHQQEIISKWVWCMYPIKDTNSLPKRVKSRWKAWVNQVLVFGFNNV